MRLNLPGGVMKKPGAFLSRGVVAMALIGGTVMISAGLADAAYLVERLDRGLVAVTSGSGTLVSWRLLGHEAYDIGFNVYKGTTKLNSTPVIDRTCYQDNSGGSGTYTVKTVTAGVEGPASENALVVTNGYINISLTPPSGCSANDCSTGDLDGDGQLDIVLKWEGANAQDNSNPGVTGDVWLEGLSLQGKSFFRIDLGPNIRAGAHYTQHIVFDLDGDGKAEVCCKTAPGTKDGSGSYIKMGPAASASHSTKYANSNGYILTGPEYFTVFEGATGKELATVDYNPLRGSVSSWGDDYGNRVDRFNSTIAYLDGARPSAVFGRGYYTRTCLWAIDWREGKLTTRWFFDGNNYPGYNAKGNHGIMAGDVDQDGKFEIVNGAMCVDDNGRGLWSVAEVGHGDAGHLTDIDPNRPGLEKWGIHEGADNWGSALLDAKTGAVIWKTANADVGRGVAADLVASSKGLECWGGTSGLRTCTNGSAGGNPSSSNFLCWWDGDLLRELEDGNTIDNYGGSRLLSATGCTSNNGTKSTPCLTADLLGDWREELVLRTMDDRNLRVYITPIATSIRLYTLMHDPQYRCQVAEEQSAYNQPPHPGFYLGDGMTLPQAKPDITYPGGVGITTAAGSGLMQKSIATSMKAHCNRTFNLPGVGIVKTVSVYDLSGKLRGTIVTHKAGIRLADRGYSNGIYLVQVRGGSH
jgi:rhamnogalacturonan endolyase